MKDIADIKAALTAATTQIAANTEQTNKANAEFRAKLDELLKKQQAVEAALEATVAAAVAAQKAKDVQEFTAAVQDVVTTTETLQSAVTEQKAATQDLDDIIPDKVTPPEEKQDEAA